MFLKKSENEKTLRRQLACLWFVVFFPVFIAASVVVPSIDFKSNVLDLVPQGKEQPLVIKAQKKMGEQFNTTLIWLVGAATDSAAYEAGEELRERLVLSGLFEEIKSGIEAGSVTRAYQKLLAYKYNFLSQADRETIEAAPDAFAQHSIDILFSPIAMQRAATLAEDPLFTLGSYIDDLNKSDVDIYKDAVLIRKNGLVYILLFSTISSTEKGIERQIELVNLYESIKNSFLEAQETVLVAGFPLYSAYGARSAKNEITSIGVLSVFCIILMVVLVFRSSVPLLLSMISIFSGVVAAAFCTGLFFHDIHIVTLVFGSSLIGISVDYAFHYFCSGFDQGWSSVKGLQKTLKSISLGMVSSVVAFCVLLCTPFPGLQQMGVFSASGLFFSWFTVVLLFPFLSSKTSFTHKIPFSGFHVLYQKKWPEFFYNRHTFFIMLTLIFIISGWMVLKVEDDVRSMQPVDARLLEQEEMIKSVFSEKRDAQYFIVEGVSVDDVLEKERALTNMLDHLISRRELEGYKAISHLYPDEASQKYNFNLIRTRFFDSDLLGKLFFEIGMMDEQFDEINDEIKNLNFTVMSVDEWVNAVPGNLEMQWLGCESDKCASLVFLSGIQNHDRLVDVAVQLPGIHYVDTVATINNLLRDYRASASVFLVGATLVIYLFLSIFLGFIKALRIILIPIVSFLLTVSALSLSGVVLSLFNILALLLVLGVGIDYAIFHCLGKAEDKATSLAVLLSVLTTLLAFGLLALSDTAVIRAFGQTVALGVFFAFILSPLVVWGETGHNVDHV